MSVVRIDTNVLASDIDYELLVQCTESLAKSFKKSKSEILVFVNSDQPIMINESQDPVVIVTLLSIDGINETGNKFHSAALFPLIAKYLKVKEDRISIAFTAVEPHAMGYNGKIFAQ